MLFFCRAVNTSVHTDMFTLVYLNSQAPENRIGPFVLFHCFQLFFNNRARTNLSYPSHLLNIWFILILFPLLFPTIQSPGNLQVNKALQLKSKFLFYPVTSCISGCQNSTRYSISAIDEKGAQSYYEKFKTYTKSNTFTCSDCCYFLHCQICVGFFLI